MEADERFSDVQWRTNPILHKAETREKGDRLYVDGYSVLWMDPAKLYELDDRSVYEQVARGTWQPEAMERTVVLRAHDWKGDVFGSARAGTAEWEEDSTGLVLHVEMDKRQVAAMDMYWQIERGDVPHQSVGFGAGRGFHEEREVRDDGSVLYTITASPELHETSFLWNPAYPNTTAEARQAEVRKRLRAAGDAVADAVDETRDLTEAVDEGNIDEAAGARRRAIRRRARIGRGRLALRGTQHGGRR